jgi:hypothetical protein
MFIRSVKVPSSSGTVHEYVRIVESVWEQGRVKQKVVANLGRRDVLDAVLPMLHRFLRGEDGPTNLAEQAALSGPVEVMDASTWGPMLVARICSTSSGCGKSWMPVAAGRSCCLRKILTTTGRAACWPCWPIG